MVYPKLQIMIDCLRNLDNSATSELGFDMRSPLPSTKANPNVYHPCGSACCIGGHAMIILKDENCTLIEDALSKLCEIPDEVSYRICNPNPQYTRDKNPWNATPDQAIKLLEYCKDTGNVDWRLAMK